MNCRQQAPVAQLDRASASGAEGHRFESCRARQLFRPFFSTKRAFFVEFSLAVLPEAVALPSGQTRSEIAAKPPFGAPKVSRTVSTPPGPPPRWGPSRQSPDFRPGRSPAVLALQLAGHARLDATSACSWATAPPPHATITTTPGPAAQTTAAGDRRSRAAPAAVRAASGARAAAAHAGGADSGAPGPHPRGPAGRPGHVRQSGDDLAGRETAGLHPQKTVSSNGADYRRSSNRCQSSIAKVYQSE